MNIIRIMAHVGTVSLFTETVDVASNNILRRSARGETFPQ